MGDIGAPDCKTDNEENAQMHERNMYANEMHMMTWYEKAWHDKIQNERQNPTTEGKTNHIAENGKSQSYKYGKLHAGCYMSVSPTSVEPSVATPGPCEG